MNYGAVLPPSVMVIFIIVVMIHLFTGHNNAGILGPAEDTFVTDNNHDGDNDDNGDNERG